MPETPHFEALAGRIVRTRDAGEPLLNSIASELRRVWNARGAADRVKLHDELNNAIGATVEALRRLERAIKYLDR